MSGPRDAAGFSQGGRKAPARIRITGGSAMAHRGTGQTKRVVRPLNPRVSEGNGAEGWLDGGA